MSVPLSPPWPPPEASSSDFITDVAFWEEVQQPSGAFPSYFNALSFLFPFLEDAQPLPTSRLELDDCIDGTIPADRPAHKVWRSRRCASRICGEDSATRGVPNNNNFYNLKNVSGTSINFCQHILMYITPLDVFRNRVPAMSASWTTSCVIENITNSIHLGGAVTRVTSVPSNITFKSCVCGNNYVALLTESNEVMIIGTQDGDSLRVGHSPENSGRETSFTTQRLRTLATGVQMIAGQENRLLGLTTTKVVKPLSVLAVNTTTVLPYRFCRYIAVGVSDDFCMIGVDDRLYKTTTSTQRMGTPRSVITMGQIPISRVAVGANFIIAIDTAGRLYTLGRNSDGQLGSGSKQNNIRTPVRHKELRKHYFVMCAAGEKHSLVLASSGDVYGCGSNEYGQLGIGRMVHEVFSWCPIQLPAPCVSIAAGPTTSFFECTDGHVYCCGSNASGLLNLEGKPSSNRIVHYPCRMKGVNNGVVKMFLSEEPRRNILPPLPEDQKALIDAKIPEMEQQDRKESVKCCVIQ